MKSIIKPHSILLTLILCLILSLATPALAQMRKAAGGTPTMGTCGTSPSVTGKDEGGTITLGTTMGTSCALNFSQTYGAAPSCWAAISAGVVVQNIATTTTTVTFAGNSAFTDSAKLHWGCIMP